jgi:hypothetical protein
VSVGTARPASSSRRVTNCAAFQTADQMRRPAPAPLDAEPLQQRVETAVSDEITSLINGPPAEWR